MGESAILIRDGSELAELKLPRLILQLLLRQGISTRESFEAFAYPQLKSMRDPMMLTDMDRAVERLLQALSRQESVCLYGDYDLDGTSGLALCSEAFRKLGFERVHLFQPDRFAEGYGLHCSALERLKNQTQCTLVVSIDLGITAMKEAAFARSIGMDLIVTDHHLPKQSADGVVELPDAIAVVNPNRGNCQSQLGHLCGAGVIFYVVLALRRAAIEQGLCAPDALDPKDLLDLFSIGTVTDLVPLVDENRVLVKHGLQRLAKTARPALKELMRALDLWGRPLNALDLGMRLAPKLNALSRMGSELTPLKILTESDPIAAKTHVDAILANNKVRQERQSEAIREAEAWVESQTDRDPLHPIVVVSPSFHRGIVGLVATRLAEKFQVPAFVGSLEQSQVVGSARVPRGSSFHLLEAMQAAEETLIQFGGHKQAAGFEAHVEQVDAFRARVVAYQDQQVSQRLTGETARSADAANGANDSVAVGGAASAGGEISDSAGAVLECELKELNETLMAWLDHFEPFGVGFQLPKFKVQSAVVTEARFLKGEHLKFKLADAGAKALEAIWFSPANPDVVQVGRRISVECELQWNYFRGAKTIQLMVSQATLVDPV